MLTGPGIAATGFLSAEPFSLPHPSCAGLGQHAESWWDTARKDADSHHEHLLCQRAKEMLLQQRRVSNHQMQGTISRCWGNVSLPQLGKVLTTVMAELLCNPFSLSYLLVLKQSASSMLSLNSDEKGMITEGSNILRVSQSTSHYAMQWHIHYKPSAVCYPQLVGACSVGCLGSSAHAKLIFYLWKSLVVSLSASAS